MYEILLAAMLGNRYDRLEWIVRIPIERGGVNVRPLITLWMAFIACAIHEIPADRIHIRETPPELDTKKFVQRLSIP